MLQALRPGAVILMGKNTMMRFCVEKYLEETGDHRWECLVKPGKKGLLEGNVGIVFTNGDLSQVRGLWIGGGGCQWSWQGL